MYICILQSSFMKKVLFTLFAGLSTLLGFANPGLWINNPQITWQQKTQGFITEPSIVVTPKGVYAEVEFTFRIHCQNNYQATDTLEAVLDFDLPRNSFIHNSWLWLDDQTIIQAAIIDKGRAIEIYEGIVKRRRDPSLLLKTGSNSYRLNVFPLTTAYPRKVKMVYSVPFNWLSDRVNIPLPIDILNTSLVQPALKVAVVRDNNFSSPYFTEQAYSGYVTGSSANTDSLLIPWNDYENGLYLNYTRNMPGGVLLNNYPTGSNAGIYQLVVDPAAVFGGQPKPKNLVLILDHQNSSGGTIHSFPKVRSLLRSFLLNNTNPTDSFNIFYADVSNNIQRTSASWSATTPAAISNALNSLPSALNSNSVSKYEALISTALNFCKSKPGLDAEVVLLSNSNQISTQVLADSSFNRIKAAVGGTLQNKIHVINNSSFATWNGLATVYSNELLYSKLALGSGGNYYKYTSVTYGYPNYVYSLDVANILSETYRHMGTNLSSFSINLPVSGGFTYARYNVVNAQRFSTSVPYVETGKYVGTLQAGTIDVQLLTNSGLHSVQLGVSGISANSAHGRQAWSDLYMNQLTSQNTMNAYTTEIIDTSISNRVLCNYTAFLALETGDTVEASANENGPGSGSGGLDIDEHEIANHTIKCYPNPFTSEITIEFIKPVEELSIFDLSGRLLLVVKPNSTDKKYVWNGRNSAGLPVPTGIYILKARTATGVITYKVMKQ